jgi:single-strand DNA-binding protein
VPKDINLLRLNLVQLTGYLGTDPELRYTPKGAAVASFSLGVDTGYRDKDSGEWIKQSSFFNIVVWNEQAERVGERFRKGSPVYVEGSLKQEKYEDKDGQPRSVVKVIARRVQFLERLPQQTQAGQGSGEPTGGDYEDPFES